MDMRCSWIYSGCRNRCVPVFSGFGMRCSWIYSGCRNRCLLVYSGCRNRCVLDFSGFGMRCVRDRGGSRNRQVRVFMAVILLGFYVYNKDKIYHWNHLLKLSH